MDLVADGVLAIVHLYDWSDIGTGIHIYSG